MRGDLLFYTPGSSWYEKVIAWANGPLCHVAVDMGDGTIIESVWNGVQHVAADTRVVAARFNTAKLVPQVSDDPSPDIERGLEWLQQQVGKPCGKEDILNQALLFSAQRGHPTSQ